jgi:ureidoacrylate peracid hydrolase
MHKINIAPEILERAKRQRGGSLELRPLDMSKTAHLIIDMQEAFLAPGATVEVPVARDIVSNVNRISATVREAGGINVFLRFTYDPSEGRPWTSWYDVLCGPGMGDVLREAFKLGSKEHQLWPELDVHDADWIIDKTRFSAFVPGTCDLDERLLAHGIDTVIVTGTLTNCCSEATARDAHQLAYKVLFVADANAAVSDLEHNATLNNLYVTFADLVQTDELIQLINSQQAVAVAAALAGPLAC